MASSKYREHDYNLQDRSDPVPIPADFRDTNHPHYPDSAKAEAGGQSAKAKTRLQRHRNRICIFLSIAMPLVVLAIVIGIVICLYKHSNASNSLVAIGAPTTIEVTQIVTFTKQVPTQVTSTVFLTPTSTNIPNVPWVPANKACIDMNMENSETEADCRKGCDPQNGVCVGWNDGFWCARDCSTQSAVPSSTPPPPAVNLASRTSPTPEDASTEGKKCVIPYDQENYQSSETNCSKLCSSPGECVEWRNDWYCAISCYGSDSKPRAHGAVCALWVSDPDCPLSYQKGGHR